jgi:hypothetical protein
MTGGKQNQSWRSDAVRLASALIIAGGLVLGGYFMGGRYETMVIDFPLITVTDNRSGSVYRCTIFPEPKQSDCTKIR